MNAQQICSLRVGENTQVVRQLMSILLLCGYYALFFGPKSCERSRRKEAKISSMFPSAHVD